MNTGVVLSALLQVEDLKRDSSEEEQERAREERRKKSLRRPPKIHAQADLLRAKTLPDLSSEEDDDQYNRSEE